MSDPFQPSPASRAYHEACEAEAVRRAPVRHLTCCVCGAFAGIWRQHWNRDTGFGVCASCVAWMRERKTSEAEILSLYGVEGVNFAGCADCDGSGTCKHCGDACDSCTSTPADRAREAVRG